MSAQKEMEKVKKAAAANDTATLEELGRSEFKTVRMEAQKKLNIIDGVVDEKGKKSAQELDREKREASPKKVSAEGWIQASLEEVKAYEDAGKLVGYNPRTGMAKVKQEEK